MESHTLKSLVLVYITFISVTDSISSNLTKTFNLNFIDHLKRILIYQSNRIVTEINVIYTNSKLVSVWDPMVHLK